MLTGLRTGVPEKEMQGRNGPAFFVYNLFINCPHAYLRSGKVCLHLFRSKVPPPPPAPPRRAARDRQRERDFP